MSRNQYQRLTLFKAARTSTLHVSHREDRSAEMEEPAANALRAGLCVPEVEERRVYTKAPMMTMMRRRSGSD